MGLEDEIRNRMNKIMKNRFDIEFFDSDLYDVNLLNSKIGISPRGLVFLFFDVENEFKIKIPEQEIVLERFTTFNNIYQIIMEQITENQNVIGASSAGGEDL